MRHVLGAEVESPSCGRARGFAREVQGIGRGREVDLALDRQTGGLSFTRTGAGTVSARSQRVFRRQMRDERGVIRVAERAVDENELGRLAGGQVASAILREDHPPIAAS